MNSCPLCATEGGLPLYRDELLRVVRVTDTPEHPAFYRVILNAHVAEFSALPRAERVRLMETVVAVERILLDTLRPAKINLASLGNVVPHLHWHVIARFDWDAHFPQPIWGTVQRTVEPAPLQRLPVSLAELDAAVVAELQGLVG